MSMERRGIQNRIEHGVSRSFLHKSDMHLGLILTNNDLTWENLCLLKHMPMS